MARYDITFVRPGPRDRPARGRRERRRGRAARPEPGEFRPMGAVPEYQERMGLHDFSEHYGRYSGGSPYSYEYAERTLYHQPRHHGPRGFSRPLGGEAYPRGRRPERGGGSAVVGWYDREFHPWAAWERRGPRPRMGRRG